MEDVVLPDTTLCAIVRDEVVNPAGGIRRFLNSIMPHVEEGVVVDTGSVDGTREALEQAKRQFPHLRVYDHEFEGYAEARNFSLSKARTGKAIVLDADEVILQKDFLTIRRILEHEGNQKYRGYRFVFKDIFPNLEIDGCGHNGRIFLVGKNYFFNAREWKYEELFDKDGFADTGIVIAHFLAKIDSARVKEAEWYESSAQARNSPTSCRSFKDWKKFNPRRNDYKASNLDLPLAA